MWYVAYRSLYVYMFLITLYSSSHPHKMIFSMLLIFLCSATMLATATEQCDVYQFDQPFFPGESCKEIILHGMCVCTYKERVFVC